MGSKPKNFLEWAKDVGSDGRVSMVGTIGGYEDAVNSGASFADHMMPPSDDYRGPIIASKTEYERAVAEGNPEAVRYISLDGESFSGQTQLYNPRAEGIPKISTDFENAATIRDIDTVSQEHNADDPSRVRMVEGTNTDIPGARMSQFGQFGGSVTGLVTAGIGLKNAINHGDTTGVIVAGADMTISSADLILDGAAAYGKVIAPGLQGAMSKANIVLTVADGVYQISQEEGLENKVARGAAVVATTGTAMAVGSAASGAVVAGAGVTAVAGTAAVVAAPIVATVAAGLVADAAVEAYKAENKLQDSISRSEDAIKNGNDEELSGAPALQNYQNLRHFALLETEALHEEGMTGQERAQRASNYEFSQDPEALEIIKQELQAKIEHYDNIIEEKDTWIPDIFEQDNVQDKWNAQIERARYVAALEELDLYEAEIDLYNEVQNEQHIAFTEESVIAPENPENINDGLEISPEEYGDENLDNWLDLEESETMYRIDQSLVAMSNSEDAPTVSERARPQINQNKIETIEIG